jgi:uncharacterized membrane protein
MKLFAYWLVFAASASIALVHGLLWRSWLPERVPTHFGINGVPNAWMSRDGALLSYFAGVAITALVLAGLVVLLPRLPVSVINIPNREYWFAEARRVESHLRISRALLLFSSATVLFLVSVFHLTFRASQQVPQSLPFSEAAPFIVAFLACVVAFVVWAFVAFRLPSAPGGPTP